MTKKEMVDRVNSLEKRKEKLIDFMDSYGDERLVYDIEERTFKDVLKEELQKIVYQRISIINQEIEELLKD